MKYTILEACIYLKTNGSLEETGRLLSDALFGGVPFGGLEDCIHEEIPAIYIRDSLMGMQIILDGEAGDYCLSFSYSPVTSQGMSVQELEKCAFFARGFEDYMKYMIDALPGVKVNFNE